MTDAPSADTLDFLRELFDRSQTDQATALYEVLVRDIAIGVAAPPSRDKATVCVAGRRADGALHVEWYETRDGITWLPEWIHAQLNPVGAGRGRRLPEPLQRP